MKLSAALVVSFLFFPVWASDKNQKCLQRMMTMYDSLRADLSSGKRKPLEISQDGTTIYLNGQIYADGELDDQGQRVRPGTGSQFLELVRKNPKVKHLVLNSPGGNVAEAQKIGEWVEARMGVV